jgi:hypothetical protein
MGLFVLKLMGTFGHPLDLWLESHSLLDHSLSQYTHWKLGRSLYPFNGVTHDENMSNRSSL